MKKIIITITGCIISALSFAQDISLTGRILDENSKDPIGYANISLEKDSKPIKGTSSMEDGSFIFTHIPVGIYTLKVSFIGYGESSRNISITGKNKDIKLGKIFLQEDSKQLEDVEIVTQGSQVKFELDKKVFSVDQSIASSGGSATEVLENIPSVEVDQEGNISLRNNSSVEIWINGKPSGLTDDNKSQVLEQMPAGSIESIEVITNPSAKYSPEGSAGIINIVMKKERKAGYYGSVNLSGDYSNGTDKIGERGGASINFNAGKFEGYYNLGFRNNYYGHIIDVDRDYLNSNGEVTSVLTQHQEDIYHLLGQMSRYGLTYNANPKNSFGISGSILTGGRDTDSNIDYSKDSSDVNLADYERLNTTESNRLFTKTTFDHNHKFSKLTEISTSLALTTFNDESDAKYLQTVNSGNIGLLNQLQETGTNNKSLELKSDFVKNFKNKSKLEAGVNVLFRDRTSTTETSNNENGSFIDVPELYNEYNYQEQQYAIYSTYGMQINKLSIQAGLRGEYLVVDNSTNGKKEDTKDYIEPYPTMFLSYSLPKNNEVQLNYTRRVQRPRGRYLNSFRNTSDSTNVTYGNPDLEPEFSSSIELNHIKTWEKHTLSTSLYYKYTNNIIQSVQFMDNAVLNTTYTNVSQSQSSGLELVSKNSLAKFFSMTTTLNLYYYTLKDSKFITPKNDIIEIEGNEDFSWNLKVLANFMLSKTFSGQITSNYASPKVLAQGKTDDQYSFDFGLRKSFMSRKLNLSLSVRDVFRTRNHSNYTYGENFSQYYYSTHYSPSFRLTLGYNFGNNGKDKKKSKNGDENEDTMEEF